jgi:aminopeptidase-like protein
MGGFKVSKKSVEILQNKIIPKNNFLCEPYMSKRGLYPTLSTKNQNKAIENLMNFLQFSDGKKDLDEISKILKLSKKNVYKIYSKLKKFKLIN